MPKSAKNLFLCLAVCLFFFNFTPAQAQDRGDPEGVLDSFYLDCGGLLGDTLVMHLRFKTDNTAGNFNDLTGLAFPVLITVTNNALIALDTGVARTFAANTAVNTFPIKTASTSSVGGADPTQSPVHFVPGVVTFSSGVVTTDTIFANIRIRLQSIVCDVIIDTLTAGAVSPQLVTSQTIAYTPAWSPNEDTCPFTNVKDFGDKKGTALPTNYELAQNYPNPFNATTQIQFALPKSGYVKLELFNVLGQKVKTLVDEELQAGYKIVTWDGTDQKGDQVSSGIYFYRVRMGTQFNEMKKMVLIK